jgi:CRP-like cAMP-binding protein/uncharacterized protein (DUF2249 family)
MSTTEHLDLRGLPVWERPSRVYDHFDRLPDGEAFTFVVENEPRGLTTSVEANRRAEMMLDQCRVGEREWHVTVRRANGTNETPCPRSILARTPAFSQLGAESLDRLARAATMHTARRGHVLVASNADWPYLGIVFEGVCAISNDARNARYRVYYEVFPHDIFGEAALFDGAPMAARAVVLSKTARYVRVPHHDILAAAAENLAVLKRVGAVIAQRSRDMMVTLANQATTPVIARIAAVLLPYAVPEAGLTPALPPLPNLTQAHIAAAAGTVKEVAARSIAELEVRGYLLRERGHIRFLDREKLIDLVKGSA